MPVPYWWLLALCQLSICLNVFAETATFFMSFTQDTETTEEGFESQKESRKIREAEALINRIKNTLFQIYEPVNDPLTAPIHLTTKEIYSQLQQLYPSEYYSEDTVAEWLDQGGFSFYDYCGNLKFEWMMRKV